MRSHQKSNSQNSLIKSATFLGLLALISLGAGCNKTETPPLPISVANNATPLPTNICDYENALQEGVSGISKQDAQTICRAMQVELDRTPSPKLLATMQKFLFGLRANFALKDTAEDFTQQTLGVVKARQQINDDDAKIINTLNVVARCYSGSDGRVTPRAIGAALRAAGDAANSLSDDGIYSLCTMIELQISSQ